MGRYTSVQTYSDESSKGGDRRTTESLGLEVSNGTYAAAEGSEEASQGASGSRKRERVEVEKIKPLTGSCAGASSSEFDIYRNARRRERDRLEEIDRIDEAEKIAKSFEERVKQNKLEADAKTSKNAEKRKKKKEKMKMVKAVNSASGAVGGGSKPITAAQGGEDGASDGDDNDE